MPHIYTTHKYIEKFICYILCIYEFKNYNADMVEQTNILLQYSTVKNDRFGLHFCLSWRRLCDYRANCYIDGKTIQCLPNILQHVPIYLNSFPVIQTVSAKKIAVFRVPQPTFSFPLETPLRLSLNISHG